MLRNEGGVRQDGIVKLDVDGVVHDGHLIALGPAQALEPVLEPGDRIGQLPVPQGFDTGLADRQRVRVLGVDF